MDIHYATIWERIADLCGDQPAAVQGARVLSWSAFEQRSAKLAGVLREAGLKPGAKVATWLYNGPEMLEARFAALKERLVPVNVNYRYVASEVQHVLVNSDSEAVFFHSSLAPIAAEVMAQAPGVRLWIEVEDSHAHAEGALRYEQVLEAATPAPRIERSADDIQLIYTGGTTGMPKGVMIRIGNAVPAGLGLASNVGIPLVEPRDAPALAARLHAEGRSPRSLVPCPLIHGTGLQLGANPYLTVGGCVILAASRRFDAHEVWTDAARRGATHITLVGEPMARPLLKELAAMPQPELAALRWIASSGAMFARETKEAMVQRLPGLTIFDLMSSTEGSLAKSFHTANAAPQTSSFVLNPMARVFDEHDEEIAPGSGQAGLIGVSGAIPLGYYKDPEKTARTFRTIRGTVWSFPGDFATVAADGRIVLQGRGSSVINTGGEKVFAEEVEEAVKRVDGVDDCLVFGQPHAALGQQVTALVSPLSAPLEATLREALRPTMAAYKLPRAVVRVEAVPRGPNGKADYAAAKRIAAAATAQPPHIQAKETT